MCTAIGIDVVAVDRIARLVGTYGSRFLNRWFTPLELDYCNSKCEPSRHLAARMAAKEAVVKVLPSWRGPLPWRSIEIANDATGAPKVRLHGPFAVAAAAAGIQNLRISLSHCDEFATGVAIVMSSRPDTTADDGRWRSLLCRVTALLRDSRMLRQEHPDPELEALHLAILMEEEFGVVLSDQDIDVAVLGDADQAAQLIWCRLGSG
jgi:holo-[acyl-carrier protein] synthase